VDRRRDAEVIMLLTCGDALPGVPRVWMWEMSAPAPTVLLVGEADVEVEGSGDPSGSGPRGPVEVRRSTRRRRTVSAYRDGDRTIVLLPARLTRAQERDWVQTMLERLDAQEARRRPTDTQLHERAVALADRWLGPGPRPTSVTWSVRQGQRFGSCTPLDGTIRVSARLRDAPAYVIDAVLLHELAHLVEPAHSARFHALVAAFPDGERATAWLEGFAAGEQSARGAAPAAAACGEDDATAAPPASTPPRRGRTARRDDVAALDLLPFGP
jgi:predicted metal-dependent hydrolase